MNKQTNLFFIILNCFILIKVQAATPENPPTTPLSPHRISPGGRQFSRTLDVGASASGIIKSTHFRYQSQDVNSGQEANGPAPLVVKTTRKRKAGHKRSFSHDDSKDENGNNSFVIEEEGEPGEPLSRARSASSAIPDIAASMSTISALLDDKGKAQQMERLLGNAHDASQNLDKAMSPLNPANLDKLIIVSQNFNQSSSNLSNVANKAIGGTIALAGVYQIVNYGPDFISLGLFGSGLAVGDFPGVHAAGKSVKENWRKPLTGISWLVAQLKRCRKKENVKE